MNIIFFMIGISLLIALGFLMAFFWAMAKGQNDDLYTPALRILIEDDSIKTTHEMKTLPLTETSIEIKKCKCKKDCSQCDKSGEMISEKLNPKK